MNTSQLLKQAELEADKLYPTQDEKGVWLLNKNTFAKKSAFLSGVQYAITHLQEQKGERVWREVDVKERLPEKSGEYNVVHINNPDYIFRDIFWAAEGKFKSGGAVVSWLEPAPPLAPENEAVGWIRVEDTAGLIVGDFYWILLDNDTPLKGKLCWDGWMAFWMDGYKPVNPEFNTVTHYMPIPAPPPTTLHHL